MKNAQLYIFLGTLIIAFGGCNMSGVEDPAMTDDPIAGIMTAATADTIFEYTVSGEGITITGFKSSAALGAYLSGGTTLRLNKIDGENVVAVAAGAFTPKAGAVISMAADTLVLPDTITGIAADAFDGVSSSFVVFIPAAVMKNLPSNVITALEAAIDLRQAGPKRLIQMKSMISNQGESRWETRINMAELLPGDLKPETTYKIVITGTSDTDMEKFHLRFDTIRYRPISRHSIQKKISKNTPFTYTGYTRTYRNIPDTAECNLYIGNYEIVPTGVTSGGVVLAILDNVEISIEETTEPLEMPDEYYLWMKRPQNGSTNRGSMGDAPVLLDIMPGGVIKNNMSYKFTVSGIPDQTLENFTIGLYDISGGSWQTLTTSYHPPVRCAVDERFTRSFMVTSVAGAAAFDLGACIVNLWDTTPIPSGAAGGELFATIRDVTITVEEIPADTYFLNMNIWQNENGNGSWRTSGNNSPALPALMPNGAIKGNTSYRVTISGTPDQTLENFSVWFQNTNPWQPVSNLPFPYIRCVKDEFFAHTFTVTTIAGAEYVDLNQCILEFVDQTPVPSGAVNGELFAQLKGVRISIAELH